MATPTTNHYDVLRTGDRVFYAIGRRDMDLSGPFTTLRAARAAAEARNAARNDTRPVTVEDRR